MTPPRRWILLLAPLLAVSPPVRARAQAGGDTLHATAPAEPRRAFGVDSLAFRGLAADVGRIWPLRIQPTTLVELRADLGPVAPNIRLVPTLSFWASRFHAAEVRRLARQI